MKKKLTIEIAEGLGNQIFMYSFAYYISKEFDYDLYIDDKSGYSQKKNLLRSHQKYMLNNFNIKGNIADNSMIFNTFSKRLKKKINIFFDKFSIKKNFLIEKNSKINSGKTAETFVQIDSQKISDNLYVQGNFENYKYFNKYKNDLRVMLTPKKNVINTNNPLINEMMISNSISIHIRRNRFSDQSKLRNSENLKKSEIFTDNIIEYINNSINFINAKVDDPKYFIWSNDHNGIDTLLKKVNLKKFTLVKNDIINDFNLFRYCKHFIVGPSSYHWWGAWLNENKNKICVRPSKINPSNNLNFWPENWVSI